MKYFKYLKIIALTLIIGVIGCSSPDSKSTNNFALLPSVAEGNFTNKISTLDVSMLKFAYSPSGDSLPIRYGLSKKIRIANEAENSQVEFSILPIESRISESKMKDEIFFSFNKLDPNLIISKAFMSLNFQV